MTLLTILALVSMIFSALSVIWSTTIYIRWWAETEKRATADFERWWEIKNAELQRASLPKPPKDPNRICLEDITAEDAQRYRDEIKKNKRR